MSDDENEQILCDQCEEHRTFPSLRKLISHMRHTEKHKPICFSCDVTFKNYKNLAGHVKVYHILKNKNCEIPCETCGKGFLTQNLLNDHCNRVHKIEENLKCNLCCRPFQNMKKLKIHTMKCLISSPEFLEYHENEVLQEKKKDKSSLPVKNEIDNNDGETNENTMFDFGVAYLAEPNLKQLKEDDQDEKKEYNNDVKENNNEDLIKLEEDSEEVQDDGEILSPPNFLKKKKKSFKKSNLIKNMNLIINNQCPDCKKVFEGKTKLKAHVKNVHTYGHYLCPDCGQEFTLKQQLKNHMRNNHDEEALKEKTCEHCQKVVRHLKMHIKEMHSDNHFICPVCAKTFTSGNQFRNHKKIMHPDEILTVLCPVCTKTFANSYYMKKHLRLVHGNMEDSPLVSCEECGKGFANGAYLQHHQKYAHEAENSVCDMCNRSYKNKRALQRHMRYAHSGKDNYLSSVKNIPSLESTQHVPQEASLSGTTVQHASPPSTSPPWQLPVLPPTTTDPGQAGQWYGQNSPVPMDIATNQLELARHQLQFMHTLQMENQAGQIHPQQQGWGPSGPKLY